MKKKIFHFCIFFCLFQKLYSQDIDGSINYSAQPVQNQEDCDTLEESYEENVFPARVRIQIGNIKDAMELSRFQNSEIFEKAGVVIPLEMY